LYNSAENNNRSFLEGYLKMDDKKKYEPILIQKKSVHEFGGSYYIGVPPSVIQSESFRVGDTINWYAIPGTKQFIVEVAPKNV
jgi:hypothetical protein